MRGLRFARDVRRQLEGITGFDGSALTAGRGVQRGPEEVGLDRAPAEQLERATFGVRWGLLGDPTCWQSVTYVVPSHLMWAALAWAHAAPA